MDFLEQKKITIKDAAKTFQISRKTIIEWKKLKKATSDVKPKENWRKRHNSLIPNEKLEEFKVFVDENNDKTFKELAEKWNGKISSRAIGRAIKRLKYSYKKKL